MTRRSCSALAISSIPPRPHAEEGRFLEGAELPPRALRGLRRALAGARGTDLLRHHAILVIDGRELRVVVQIPLILVVEHDHRDGLPAAAVLIVHELSHDVRVLPVIGLAQGIGRLAELLPVAVEDAQLHAGGLGHPRQHGHVAPAIGRPVLRQHEDLGRPARLGGQPLPRPRLGIGEAASLVPFPHHRGVVGRVPPPVPSRLRFSGVPI